jgi:hypothetical protein
MILPVVTLFIINDSVVMNVVKLMERDMARETEVNRQNLPQWHIITVITNQLMD